MAATRLLDSVSINFSLVFFGHLVDSADQQQLGNVFAPFFILSSQKRVVL